MTYVMRLIAEVDFQMMTILSAVGGAGATAVGATWAAMRGAYKGELKTLRERVDDCEQDRTGLHAQVDKNAKEITLLSQQLGRLEGRMERNGG